MTKYIKLVVLLCLSLNVVAQSRISLAGQWQFRIDRQDEGLDKQWYKQKFNQTVKLPGAMQAQGYGDEPSVKTPWIGEKAERFLEQEKYAPYRVAGNYKFPFWLTPVKYYTGAAWYQKEVNIPAGWKNKRITLTLERCHWGSTLFADDRYIGADSSLGTAHVYDLSHLTPGKHILSIRIDNRYLSEVGVNAHSASDQTQGTWNGIVGDITLEAGNPVYIKNIQVYPDIDAKQVKVTVKLGNTTSGKLTVSAKQVGKSAALPAIEQAYNDSVVAFTHNMGNNPVLWDEFNQGLYDLTVKLTGNNSDVKTARFGMRSVGKAGSKITINGKPVFLRGTLECAIFPLTGHPPTDTASWARIYRIMRAHGLNHLRFHSYCPPEAAFVAADNAGIYLSVEVDAWATFGEGLSVDRYIYEQSNRFMESYGNHPSFCMLIPSNEPAGDQRRDPFLGKFVQYWKEKDNRRIYAAGSGWPAIAENDFHSSPDPRIQVWGAGINSIINAEAPNSKYEFSSVVNRINTNAKTNIPVVAHEIGQWCVYPDFNEIKKYKGLLQARNFEIFRDFMKRENLQGQSHDFLMASGKLQALCYKADIEAGMRTGYAGYQLLDLHDFPGQGTALVGILDPFWNSKPYYTPAAFHRFASATVPLALMNKFTFTNAETFKADVQVSHFGKEQLKQAALSWRITNAQKQVLAQGNLKADLDLRNDNPAGAISFPLAGIKRAEKLNLEITVKGLGINDWDFWVYPATVNTTSPQNILTATSLTPEALAKLDAGGTVLLLLNGRIAQDKGAKIITGMSTVFWNTEWTTGQAPHTLGILCNPKSPLFAGFPTEYHSNWQWWDILHTAQTMHLKDFPAGLTPSVQLIDTWFEARKLGLLFEGKVGKGKIVVTSIDFSKDLDKRLGARQLYHSLLGYMNGKTFNPQVALEASAIKALYQ
ncbi:sugar-binding domain-containing protein [uncultured Chitinophaga sp.]|uniref:sugar-binding domain-containing protein n=1 Tax=uncultured Chitinophaga sp. TaxID=339340 RepID=UPI0025F2FB20|nr:sugar-binding domain-containing protein [uncultured Chitinophaga sp.]